jgi:hypothetical protein
MTDIEVKQLIERLRQRSNSNYMLMSHPPKPAPDADCHMAADLLQEALAFKQEASDIVTSYLNREGNWLMLQRLLIPKPKPDPLVRVLDAMKDGRAGPTTESYAACLRAALDAVGLEIREKK